MLGGRGVRFVLQAVYFILIARGLGTSEYGAFIGAVSLVSLGAAFSGLGFGWMLVEQVSRDRGAFARAWGNAILMTVLSGVALLCLILLIVYFGLRSSFTIPIVALVGISDLIVVRLVDLAAQTFQAIEVLKRAAEVDVVLGAVRTFAAVVMIFARRDASAFFWSELYLASGVVAALYALVLVSRNIGPPRLRLTINSKKLHDGFFYAISTASQTAYNDIDKTMLVRLVGLEATGIYGAAYRIIDVTFVPISALVYASSARFFQHGASGISTSTQYARKLLPYVALYGLLAVCIVVAASPLIPIVLGGHFAESAKAVRWLSPIILFRGVHYLFSNALTGSGFQRIRSAIQIVVAIMNVLLNLWLIPVYSWHGAAYASIICDGSLVLFFWCASKTMIARTLSPSDLETCGELEIHSR